MNDKDQVNKTTIFSATKVEFNYTIKIIEKIISGEDSLLIPGINPSKETIKTTIENHVTEIAVKSLAGSEGANAKIDIKIIKTTKISTQITIKGINE